MLRYAMPSLVPRQGRGKTAWAPLLAHARRSHKNMGIRTRCTFSAYTLVISRNISAHDYECLSVLLQPRNRIRDLE